MRIVTDGVLAGAYASAGARRKGIHNMMPNQKILTHAYDDDDRSAGAKTLCRKLTLDKFAGAFSDDPPTCKLCLKRDPRFQPKPAVTLNDVIAELRNYELNGSDPVKQIRGIYSDLETATREAVELRKAKPLNFTAEEFTDLQEALDFYVEARGEFRDIDPEVQAGLEALQAKLAKTRP